MAIKQFAIKDAIDLNVKQLGQSQALMTINYLNDCEFSTEAEVIFAKKKGINAVSFPGARTGTLTLNAELADVNWLGMSLGGNVVGEKIEVTDTILNKAYLIEGTFRVAYEDGTEEIKKITFHKATPQVSSTIAFSAENVASFSLVFDLLADANGKFITIDTNTVTLEAE
ncbi:MAG: hypothetical protein ACRDA3_13040 [Peptostreptococcaceae bacterium]